MQRATITTAVKKSITENWGVDPETISDESTFANDLGADSLDKVELMMKVEKQFNVSIPDEDFDNMNTVGKMIDWLEEHVAGHTLHGV